MTKANKEEIGRDIIPGFGIFLPARPELLGPRRLDDCPSETEERQREKTKGGGR